MSALWRCDCHADLGDTFCVKLSQSSNYRGGPTDNFFSGSHLLKQAIHVVVEVLCSASAFPFTSFPFHRTRRHAFRLRVSQRVEIPFLKVPKNFCFRQWPYMYSITSEVCFQLLQSNTLEGTSQVLERDFQQEKCTRRKASYSHTMLPSERCTPSQRVKTQLTHKSYNPSLLQRCTVPGSPIGGCMRLPGVSQTANACKRACDPLK